jgi:hypothetical protein
VQQVRFAEVKQGLHMAIWDIEDGGTQLRKLVKYVTSEVTVDEMYFRINELAMCILSMLMNRMVVWCIENSNMWWC